MKYIIRSTVLVDAVTAEISEEQFLLARTARSTLTSGFDAEEIFDLFLSNYLEVERQCMSAAIHRLARDLDSYAEFYEQRAPINRAVVNFLSTARLYVDQIGTKVSACLGNVVDAKSSVKELLSREFEAAFEYRFIEALRNHVQHSGTAVHTLKSGMRSSQSSQATRRESGAYVCPFVERRFLAEDGEFKAAVLRECPSSVNLLDCIRVYAESISRVHRKVRRMLDTELQSARTRIQGLREILASHCEGDLDALVAVEVDDAGIDHDVVPLLLEWESVRQWMGRRNAGLTENTNSYATGRTEG